jgi:hypothetical protein
MTARQRLAAFDTGTFKLQAWNPTTDNTVRTLAAAGASVYAGGYFATANGSDRNNAAAFDTVSGALRSWAPAFDEEVQSFYIRGRLLYACGNFRSVNGIARDQVCALDTANMYLSPFSVQFDQAYSNYLMYSLAFTNSHVISAGDFRFANGTVRNGLAAFTFNPLTLPVHLTTFRAAKESSAIRLYWSTASETNSREFVVLRSYDRSAWVALGSVPASGNSTSTVSYTFADHADHDGRAVVYYQLKQVDRDARAALSQVVAVPLFERSYTVHPNPFTGKVEIGMQESLPEGSDLVVYDLCGRVQHVQYVASGTKTISVDLTALAPNALYIARIGSLTIKLLKQD